ncbi:hypothetical protein GCM10023116_32470 [Kistimonas scapharcae]|uniref:DUF4194 domain-containing protein n=1 Tax=Kistimonas scapharcae TaxID=1036133 RepID=A0ABP8V4P1_9GAMM
MSQFTNLAIQHFMSTPFVCRYTNEDIFNALERDEFREQVNQTLAIFNRAVIQTRAGNAYVCCYNTADTQESKTAIREHFRISAQDLQPLVLFLGLCQSSSPSSKPVKPGSKVSKGEILTAVQGSDTLLRQLDQIRHSRLLSSSATDATNILGQVLKRLKDLGYLKSIGSGELQYTATGLWDVLYEQLQFIQQYHEISSADEEYKQENLI